VEALKELAPEAAIVPFVKLMQDQNENRQLRLSAAMALEDIGDQRVIDPFMWAFANDPFIRGTAANGLARIGGTGVGFLFEVLYRGDSSLRQASATAIAFQGDEQAKAALKEVITTGQVPAEGIPKDVFDELDSANQEK
jgi:HEAT repeat protein